MSLFSSQGVIYDAFAKV